MPLEPIEIASGTEVFDWTVPKEWVVREAFVVGPDGRRILDVRQNNLHVVNYSIPFKGTLGLEALNKHLHSLPDQPDAIPYVTSYYQPCWGFCLTQEMRDALPDGEYTVVMDTEFVEGSMRLSEVVLPGKEREEILISTYTCHPSMANNELSGPLVAAFLYRRLAQLKDRRLTYRFVLAPETIGAISYLKLRGSHLKENLVAGFVLTTIGDRAPFTYKRSRAGSTVADRAALYALGRISGDSLRVLDYWPMGSDERQYCSPGFNLPVGCIARSIYGSYPEYHTSLDNKSFISFDSLVESVDACFAICSLLDQNRVYRNVKPYGEPCLVRYGLYPALGASKKHPERLPATMWFLNLADGTRDLLAIAERSGHDFWLLREIADDCLKAGLVEEAGKAKPPSGAAEKPRVQTAAGRSKSKR